MKLKSILLLSASAFAFGSSFAQSNVTTGGQKYTLIEEGTGAWCQYCPDGSQWLQEKIEPTYPRVIVASFHDDYGGIASADGMTIKGSPDNPYNSTTGYITGFPMGTVDRASYAGSIGLSRTSWNSAMPARNSAAAAFDVKMASIYDPTTRIIQIKVTAKTLVAGTGTWRLNAYITEDSIPSVGSGFAQSNNYTSPTAMSTTGSLSWWAGKGSPISPASLYSHMNVVRAILPANYSRIWGDSTAILTNPKVGDSVVKVYTYTIPAGYTDYRVKVIGLIQKYGAANTDRAIENCILARVRNMQKNPPLAVGATAKVVEELTVFPNPATNSINLQCALNTFNPTITQVTITNVAGQVILTKEYAAGGSLFMENISLDKLGNGVYFVTLANSGETTTKQFLVQK